MNGALGSIPDLHMAFLDDLSLAKQAEIRLALRFDLKWRSWFLEVGRGDLSEYVQVFQP